MAKGGGPAVTAEERRIERVSVASASDDGDDTDRVTNRGDTGRRATVTGAPPNDRLRGWGLVCRHPVTQARAGAGGGAAEAAAPLASGVAVEL